VNAIVGLGDLVHDAHYERLGDTLRYTGSRGGGSVWNILANAYAQGAEAMGVGFGGLDDRREVVLDDHKRLGIDMLWAGTHASRATCTMHHFPRPNPPLYGGQYQTTGRCRVCLRRTDFAKLRDASTVSEAWSRIPNGANILVVDRLTTLRTEWARELKVRGWLTAIDIGYPGYLSTYKPESIAEQLGSLSLVFVQGPVANALMSKLHEADEAGVARRLECVFIVSNGDQGMWCFDGRGGNVRRFQVQPPACVVTDTVGAGDCFFGSLLASLVAAGDVGPDLRSDLRALEQFCNDAMENVIPALAAVGARGHLAGGLDLLPSAASRSGDPGAMAPLPTGSALGPCEVCGDRGSISLSREEKSTPVPLSRINVAQIRKRVAAVVETQSAVQQCRNQLEAPGRTVVCGTGGSYAAARAIAALMNHRWTETKASGGLAVAMRPLEAMEIAGRVDRFIAISYSGRSPDVWRSMEEARFAGVPCVLVTAGRPPESVRSDSELEIIRYGSSDAGSQRTLERGFISFAGTVAPVALWTAAVAGLDLIREVLHDVDLSRDAAAIGRAAADVCGQRGGGIAVVAGHWGAAAMNDIESKFVEGALAPVLLHDMKDFSHGRFVSVSSERASTQAVLVLGVGEPSEYEDSLLRALRDGTEDVFELRTNQRGPVGSLDLLLASQTFGVEFASALGVDISVPTRVDPAWNRLYRWDGPL
jgi:sugar/nucleoside kinase (ribokinase family)/phosphoheptose isomerase